MQITTKFNVGDTVWSVTDTCHVTRGEIYQIAVSRNPGDPVGATTVEYWCRDMKDIIYREEQLCASYEELLQRISKPEAENEED